MNEIKRCAWGLSALVLVGLLGCSSAESACGLDAEGCSSDCQADACAIETVAVTQGDISEIVVHGGYVYWLEFSARKVMKAPIGGGEPVVIASDQMQPEGLAVGATHVYWGIYGALMRAPIDGGAAETFVAVPGNVSRIVQIALDAENIVWREGRSTGFPGAIRRMPLAGGQVVTLMDGNSPDGMALDDGYVYSANLDSIQRTPLAGGASETLVAGRDFAQHIAVGGGELYWGEQRWMGTAPIGGAPRFFQIGSLPADMKIDAEYVYWSEVRSGTLMKARRKGGAPVVVDAQPGGVFFDIDDTYIYWGDLIHGAVKRIHK